MSDALFCEKSLSDLPGLMATLGQRARKAARLLATAPTQAKDTALRLAAQAIRRDTPFILAENGRDMDAGRERGLSGALLDRLELTPARIDAIAKGLEDIADLPDPVGAVLDAWDRPNGLHLERVRTPLGVIGVIYESRPNVTADAGALCLKSGNAVILRGGSESFHSARALYTRLLEGLQGAGLPQEAIQMVPTTDRDAVGILLTMTDDIDVIVPRGGRGLIERITRDSRIPLFKHLEGLCHTYIHKDADPGKARALVLNAKMRRTGVCGSTETVLVDQDIAADLLPLLVRDLTNAGCEVRGCEVTRKLCPTVTPATDADWDTEYLDAIVSIRVVTGLDQALEHIVLHSSDHTDAIVTENQAVADRFLTEVDSAIVMHNASTQFADGGEFGMGAEIGISTGRLHARGPVGVEQLTIFKYKVRGNGQCRP